ncbi:MAG TPA: 2-C-methyl-D-erythritol 4-phosphate cytidylyltransferase [Pseudonocardia sp.]|nr:2-C-methyl-D-erythritol 4-phosphate cytidylyltransferase [Pseudonocardia sp.]
MPGPLTPVAGVPMLSRTVLGLFASGAVGRVLVDAARVRGVREALAAAGCAPGEDVVVFDDPLSAPAGAHGGERPEAFGGDAYLGAAEVVLVHDAHRPLTPPGLVASVVASARAGHAVTVPVLPLTDTVKRLDAGTWLRAGPDRAGLCVVQTPQAFRVRAVGADLPAVLAAPPARAYAATDRRTHTVAGHPHALALRGPGDVELAEALADLR